MLDFFTDIVIEGFDDHVDPSQPTSRTRRRHPHAWQKSNKKVILIIIIIIIINIITIELAIKENCGTSKEHRASGYGLGRFANSYACLSCPCWVWCWVWCCAVHRDVEQAKDKVPRQWFP